jgi:hypothetical protein
VSFGRYQGDKRALAQRAALAGCETALAVVETSAADLDALHDQHPQAWISSEAVEQADRRLAKMRELLGLLQQRAAVTRDYIDQFDDPVAFLGKELASIGAVYDWYAAITVARALIHQDTGRMITASDPATLECQLVLLEDAEALLPEMQRQIDELTEIRRTFPGPWPELLDLAAMQAGQDDAAQALAVYRTHVPECPGGLPAASAVTMRKISGSLRYSLGVIQDLRTDLAVHMATTYAIRNSERPHAQD